MGKKINYYTFHLVAISIVNENYSGERTNIDFVSPNCTKQRRNHRHPVLTLIIHQSFHKISRTQFLVIEELFKTINDKIIFCARVEKFVWCLARSRRHNTMDAVGYKLGNYQNRANISKLSPAAGENSSIRITMVFFSWLLPAKKLQLV